jgi:hypothetical protein
MVHQDSVQTTWGYPPVLYGAYERENHESQLKREKEKKWYKETEPGRTLVAPCDARDRATCIFCRDGTGEGNTEGYYEKSLADASATSLGVVGGLGTHKSGGRHGCE